ncbi:uncharacterized protein LOC144716083 [Wolffia australiana]
MTQSWPDYSKASKFSSPSTSHFECTSDAPPRISRRNVFLVLAWREISPQTRKSSRRLLGGISQRSEYVCGPECLAVDAKRSLESWVEADSLQHLTATYCPLLPPPRSTIAAAFSSDGKKLASTHGDHTVKISDCQSGKRLKVLSGHRRTPWVVRFHPLHSHIVASGSLDHEVRLWDANTDDCICSHVFYRPIASIAFHAQGDFIAVASGHRLFIWNYKSTGESSSPAIVLKTRRSLRAVHFHPLSAPFLLTAEVNYLDSSDSPLTLATSSGYSKYPPPTVFVSNSCSSSLGNLENSSSPAYMMMSAVTIGSGADFQSEDGVGVRPAGMASALQRHEYTLPSSSGLVVPMRVEESNSAPAESVPGFSPADLGNADVDVEMNMEETIQGLNALISHERSPIVPANNGEPEGSGPSRRPANLGNTESQNLARSLEAGSCPLPYFPGWLMGLRQGSLHPILPLSNTVEGAYSSVPGTGPEVLPLELPQARYVEVTRAATRPSSRPHSRPRLLDLIDSEGIAQNDETRSQLAGSNIGSEVAASLVAAAAAELPCTVKLRIWLHEIHNPCAPLDSERCRLTIPHAVLCSEMGAHFSPCGRYLAACVACVLPHMEVDHGLSPQTQLNTLGAATSPTRHPISSHQVMYELRVYSLEEITFGAVLASRAIRAAHCLTSIQFSPTSEHILLAYGRRHSSLLRSVVCNGETTLPIFTILEVYRASDMELVRVLPSAEDEVNVACFHPLVGGGLVYGTKEGKLRILQYDSRDASTSSEHRFLQDEHLMETQR